MVYSKLNLPEYPVICDVWDKLKAENRPIVVYGMGNGADKLFRRFEKYSIKVSDIFASDGFVRGHSFRGYRVKSLSEIESEYDDFVIVLSFASNRAEVIDMLHKLSLKHELIVPDMPVAGEDEYFDREFYNNNYDRILKAYSILDDDESKNCYCAVINYKLSGKIEYLLSAYSEKGEMYSMLSLDKIRVMLDGGAYNGDTCKEAVEYFPNIEKIIAVEPDNRNYRKLLKYAQNSDIEIECVNGALWDRASTAYFLSSANRNSSVNSTPSYKKKEEEVGLITVDSLLENTECDYIKYDVEGAELEALCGSEQSILSGSPQLLVSLYHRSRDIFTLPLLLKEKYPWYKFYIRRLLTVPAWEVNLIMIPDKLK